MRFEEGTANAHSATDPKYAPDPPQALSVLTCSSRDQRSLANKLEREAKKERESDENHATITDPLAPARSHGNEPSRGAKIDAQIQQEEEEELRRKGKI